MLVFEAYGGAGGAAIGLEAAGFEHAAIVEVDPDACDTLRANGFENVYQMRVGELDRCFHPDLLWASFPCQPFSSMGSRLGVGDDRNGWPDTRDQIDRQGPTVFLAENVLGLTQHQTGCTRSLPLFGDPPPCSGCYLDNVIMRDLRDRFACSGWFVMDASRYGVPQIRKRVIVWGAPQPLKKPAETHGKGLLPLVSVRDAIGIDARMDGGRNSTANPNQERQRTTLEPCFTLGTKGNAMARFPDGTSRRLTPREEATIQGFPTGYRFCGRTKGDLYRQIGNALPPKIAELVGLEAMAILRGL